MRLTIRDLERESGLSRRTIHFYAQEGLLPAPDGVGPSSTYGEEHLLRLRLIPTLKTAGLRLDRIGCALDGLTLAQMRRLLRFAPDGSLDDPVQLAEWLQRGRGGADDEEAGASPAANGKPVPATDGVPGGRWIRHRLAPGVELRYRDTGTPEHDAKLRQLREMARRLFDDAPR